MLTTYLAVDTYSVLSAELTLHLRSYTIEISPCGDPLLVLELQLIIFAHVICLGGLAFYLSTRCLTYVAVMSIKGGIQAIYINSDRAFHTS